MDEMKRIIIALITVVSFGIILAISGANWVKYIGEIENQTLEDQK